MANKQYWLAGRDTYRYATRFNHTFQLIDEADVTALCRQCNEETLEGFFSKTNIGDMILSLFIYPIGKNMVGVGTIMTSVTAGRTTYNGINNRNMNPMYIFDMGNVFYPANNFVDMDGYTVIKVFLPYYGYIELNPNDCANKYVCFRMGVDFTTGEATYYVGVCDEEPPTYTDVPAELYGNNQDEYYDIRIIKTVTFQLGYALPTSSSNANERLRNAAISALTSGAGLAVTAATGNPIPFISTFSSNTPSTTSIVTAAQAGARQQTTALTRGAPYAGVTPPIEHAKGDKKYVVTGVSETINAGLTAIGKLPYSINSSAPKSTAALFFASTHIHFITIKPKIKQQNAQFNHLFGKPLGETRLLSTLSGYTKISNIHFDSALLSTATEEEKAMLKEACLQGIYL